jgi:hypothetical protein
MSAEIIRAGSALPRIAEARPLNDRKVEITWKDGCRKTVDLKPALASRRQYIALRTDDTLFATLRVSEYGDAIEWENGLDFSAIWLDTLAPADFCNAEFRDAMDTLELSLDGMAAALEISRRQIADFRKDKPIPRHIALATRYLLEHDGKTRQTG